jgi:hypothetical protein
MRIPKEKGRNIHFISYVSVKGDSFKAQNELFNIIHLIFYMRLIPENGNTLSP